MMTKKQPLYVFGELSSESRAGGTRDRAYTNQNWIKTGPEFGKEMFGLWGYADAETGNLNSIGFIEKDTECVSKFKSALGQAYTWKTPLPGTELERPVRPAQYKEQILELEKSAKSIDEGKIPGHEHDDIAETALVVITVLVYVALMAMVGVLIYMCCQERKSGGNMAGKFN